MKLKIINLLQKVFKTRQKPSRYDQEADEGIWSKANYEAIQEMKSRLAENHKNKSETKRDLMVSISRGAHVEKIRTNLNEGIYPGNQDTGSIGILKID
ncbi:MAG: hypothetical protein AAGF96_06145 [Bacteroidota bacterium]